MAKKTAKLKFGDRDHAITLLNAFKGDMETLAAIVDDIKKIRITDEDKTMAKWTVTPIEDGKANLTWENELLPEIEVELEKETVKYLMDTVEKKSKDNEFTPADMGIMDLYNIIK